MNTPEAAFIISLALIIVLPLVAILIEPIVNIVYDITHKRSK